MNVDINNRKASGVVLITIALLVGAGTPGPSQTEDRCPTRGKIMTFEIMDLFFGAKKMDETIECPPPGELTPIAESNLETHPPPPASISPSFMMKRTLGLTHCSINAEGQAGYTEMDDPFYVPTAKMLSGVFEGFDIFMSVIPTMDKPGIGEIDVHVGSDSEPAGSYGNPGDLFILGDYRTPYYTGKSSPAEQDNDFVYIVNFDPTASIIRLHGSPDDYTLAPVCKMFPGTAIFYKKNKDMTGVVAGVLPEQLDLAGPRFEYDKAPSMNPAIPGVDQIYGLFAFMTDDDLGNAYMYIGSVHHRIKGAEDDGNFYLAKFDRTGKRKWIGKHGTPWQKGAQLPWKLTTANGSLFITGTSHGGYGGIDPKCDMVAFAAKFDLETGKELAAVQVTPDPLKYDGLSWGIDADNGNHVYVIGSTSKTPYHIVPALSPYLVKLRQSDLSVAWTETIVDPESNPIKSGGAFDEALGGVVFVPDGSGIPGHGHVYIAGFSDRGDFFGACPGRLDVWYVKYDHNGNRLWGKAFGVPTEHDYPWDIEADHEGNFYVVGMTNGPMDGERYHGQTDGFIRKMDPDGDQVWTRLIGGDRADIIYSIDIEGDNIFVSGYTRSDLPAVPAQAGLAGKNRGMSDAFAAKLNLDGDVLGVKQLGSEKIDMSYSVAASDGVVFVSGQTEGSMIKPLQEAPLNVFLTTLDAETFRFLQ